MKPRKPLKWTGKAWIDPHEFKSIRRIANLYREGERFMSYIPVRVTITEILKKRGGR